MLVPCGVKSFFQGPYERIMLISLVIKVVFEKFPLQSKISIAWTKYLLCSMDYGVGGPIDTIVWSQTLYFWSLINRH